MVGVALIWCSSSFLKLVWSDAYIIPHSRRDNPFQSCSFWKCLPGVNRWSRISSTRLSVQNMSVNLLDPFMDSISLTSMYLVSTVVLASAILLRTLLTLFGRRYPLHPANLASWSSANPWTFIGDGVGTVGEFTGCPISVAFAIPSWSIKTTFCGDAFLLARTPNVASNRGFSALSIRCVGAVAAGNVSLFCMVAPAGFPFSAHEAANK